MAVELNGGAVFFHCPKTGGTTVRRFLTSANLIRCEIGLPHAPPIAVDVGDVFTFSFVRHPATWLQSFWTYRELIGWYGPPRPNGMADVVGSLHACGRRENTFQEFVADVTRDHPGYIGRLFDLFSSHCGFVGRQERLKEDLAIALTRAGVAFDEAALADFPSQNIVSRRRPMACAYTPELADAIVESERATFENYGYDTCVSTFLPTPT